MSYSNLQIQCYYSSIGSTKRIYYTAMDFSINTKMPLDVLTEAQCKRKDEGVSTKTGHASRKHVDKAIACQNRNQNIHI